MFRIVRTNDHEVAEKLDRRIFEGESIRLRDHVSWIVNRGRGDWPVAFLSALPSPLCPGALYIERVGVCPSSRGRGLQLRLMRVAERYARAQGIRRMVSYTRSDNIHSANNFIRADWRLWDGWDDPPSRTILYWEKRL